MNLKYKHLPYVMGAALGIAISFLSHAADNVSLNFTGTIKASTCDVGAGSLGQTVQLGSVSTTVFGNPGDVSSAQPFSLVLDCPAGGPDSASVTFTGTGASDPTLLALDAGGTANGVAVRINNAADGSKIDLGTASAVITLASGINDLKFTAQYQALVDRPMITAGTADATAQFTVNYP